MGGWEGGREEGCEVCEGVGAVGAHTALESYQGRKSNPRVGLEPKDPIGWDCCRRALQVAAALARGVEAGAYHLPSPDLGQTLLIALMTSLSPKSLPLPLLVLLGPFLPIVSSILGWLADRTARKYNERTAAAAAAGGSAGAGPSSSSSSKG